MCMSRSRRCAGRWCERASTHPAHPSTRPTLACFERAPARCPCWLVFERSGVRRARRQPGRGERVEEDVFSCQPPRGRRQRARGRRQEEGPGRAVADDALQRPRARIRRVRGLHRCSKASLAAPQLSKHRSRCSAAIEGGKASLAAPRLKTHRLKTSGTARTAVSPA